LRQPRFILRGRRLHRKIYHCKVCDYIGALVVEADEEMAKAIREDYEQKKNE